MEILIVKKLYILILSSLCLVILLFLFFENRYTTYEYDYELNNGIIFRNGNDVIYVNKLQLENYKRQNISVKFDERNVIEDIKY